MENENVKEHADQHEEPVQGEATQQQTDESADISAAETGDLSDTTTTPQAESTTEPLSELDEMKKKNNELNDKYLRLYSEFENYRKRTAREKLDIIGTASADLMKNLLPVIDDFERAIKANEKVEDVNALKEGFILIHHRLESLLQQKGLKPMEAQGQPFDVDLHEALTNIPAPTDDMKGKVVDVVEKGYYLNDTVIRYAKVVVGQ